MKSGKGIKHMSRQAMAEKTRGVRVGLSVLTALLMASCAEKTGGQANATETELATQKQGLSAPPVCGPTAAFASLTFSAPTTSGSTIRYSNVGAYNGQNLDLLVVVGATTNATLVGGVIGNDARLQLTPTAAGNASVPVTLTTVLTGTSTPVPTRLTLGIGDLDGTATFSETVTFTKTGTTGYRLGSPTNLRVIEQVTDVKVTSTAQNGDVPSPAPHNIRLFTAEAASRTVVLGVESGAAGATRFFDIDGNLEIAATGPCASPVCATEVATGATFTNVATSGGTGVGATALYTGGAFDVRGTVTAVSGGGSVNFARNGAVAVVTANGPANSNVSVLWEYFNPGTTTPATPISRLTVGDLDRDPDDTGATNQVQFSNAEVGEFQLGGPSTIQYVGGLQESFTAAAPTGNGSNPSAAPNSTSSYNMGALFINRSSFTTTIGKTTGAAASIFYFDFTNTSLTATTNTPLTNRVCFSPTDLTAPAAPVIAAPVDGSTSTATAVPVSGTCETGATVTVSEGATTVCTAACVAGSFTCSPTPNFSQGPHTLTAIQTDPSGNVSPASAPVTFTVDSVAPAAPTISAPAEGSTVGTTPTISGACETGATVNVSEGATVLCSNVACVAGAYSCTSSVLAAGPHTITATQTDTAGNTSPASTPRNFTVALPAICGDGSVTGAETCDDGNTTPGDGCSAVCAIETGYTCVGMPSVCTPVCGDNITTPPETCDDGNTVSGDGCSATCRLEAPVVTVNPPAVINQANATAYPVSGSCTAGQGNVAVAVGTVSAMVPCSPAGTYATTLDVSALPDAAMVPVTAAQMGPGGATMDSKNTSKDTTPPETTIAMGPGAVIPTSTATFTFTSPDPTATFECSIDGGPYAACPANYTTPTLMDGPHTLNVRARDAAGNVDPTPASQTWTVDTAEPDTVINTGPTGTVTTSTNTFTFSSPTAGATFECRINGGAWAVCTTPYSTGMLADGTYTFDVRAVNMFGVKDSSPASSTFTIDSTPPETAIASGPMGTVTTSTSNFTFTSPDPTATFECSIDGGMFVACPANYTTSSLPDGMHTLTVRAIDPFGNVDPTPETRTWTIDAAEPDTTITSGPNGFVNTANNTFTFTSTKPNSTFQCKIDGGAFMACTTPFSTGVLMDGPHTFEVYAIDMNGKVDPSPARATFTIDTSVPETDIASGPMGTVTTPTSTFTFTSPEAGVTFECRIGMAMFVACPATYTTSALPDGTYTIEVRAVDAAGNVDQTPAKQTWTVDTGEPETTITMGPAAVVNTPTSMFTFTSDDPMATFECSIDGGAYAACPATYTSPTLPDGAHTLSVRAKDAAGNVDSSPATRSWIIDTNPPETEIATGPAEGSTETTSNATFTFTSPEAGVTFECKLDGAAAFTACPASYTVSGLANGSHTLEVRAVDAAGNVDPTPAKRTWTVAIPVGVPTVAVPADNSISNNPLPVVTGTAVPGSMVKVFVDTTPGAAPTCTTTADAMGNYSCPLTVPLADGPHTVLAVATVAGVDSPPSDTNNFVVDTKAPPIAWTAPVANSVVTDPTPALTGTSEPGATVTVFLDGSMTPVCTVAVPASGIWSCVPASSLSDGPHTATAQAKDAAGNTSPVAVLPFSVDVTAPDAPVIVAPEEGGKTSPNPTISGTGEPGATVTVQEAGTVLCTALVDAFGNWSCVVTTPLTVGPHAITATAEDQLGNTSPASPVRNFTVAANEPVDAPTITAPIAGAVTKDTTPIVGGGAVPGATVDVYIDGVKACTTTADAMGKYSCQVSPALADGPHVATATQTVGGVTSAPSTQIPFVVDTKAPAAPVVVAPAEGSTTNELPVYSGTSEPGSTVKVTVDNGATPVCTTVADAAGKWSCPQPTSLAPGKHAVSAVATDKAGNDSPISNVNNFTVAVGQPPAAPVVTTPADGSLTNDTLPVYAGNASPGLTVEVFVDGGTTPVCTTVADATGKWTAHGESGRG
jgi:large repetitive protein